ncbi:protocatechuate 4,5-dioxygenase subunit alpha [Solwaraspora sp. WMMB335]|uniref:protocatechuate 4,5-dioxygenase subunit alpha n=1 Tax=Solwaraspora sp. WMMB335 TaxID=3404118 RepID=UPI003B922AB7
MRVMIDRAGPSSVGRGNGSGGGRAGPVETRSAAMTKVDVPGTYVFDGRTSRLGYRMNKLFMSLNDPAARETFTADEAAYCDRYALSAEQKRAVMERDWQAMLDAGGSIFYVYKLAMMEGLSMQYLGGVFTGMTEQEFVAAMVSGGRRDG